jgi:adenosylhomocysteine nucleosidase
MKLLMIASDPGEFSGILAHADRCERVAAPVDWARSARFRGHEALLAANGAGAVRAAAAVDAGLKVFRADALVSTGYCGALDPKLDLAAVVVGTQISSGDQIYPALAVTGATAHYAGVVCTIDHVAQTAEEKRRLHGSGACAVEMEAAGVAERALALGLPFYCVRAVTDLAGETMANNYNAALRPDGHFATMHILGSSLRHPSARLPELFRLRNRCIRAANILGDFFADCRF